jgi:5-methylcytosine-specific restriction endonuclease McrA
LADAKDIFTAMQNSKLLNYSPLQKELLSKYNCRKRAINVNNKQDCKISADDILVIIERQNRKCFYCNSYLDPKYYQIDHFYPKSMGGKTIITNLVATCRWCNTMKNALDGHAFIKKCKCIVENNHLAQMLKIENII